MASFNNVTLMGRMTRDWEVREAGEHLVAKTGLALNDREKVTFVDVTTWGKQAEVAPKYTFKGSEILVSGRLTMDEWEQDGKRRVKLYVTADRIVFTSKPQDAANVGACEELDSVVEDGDNLPF